MATDNSTVTISILGKSFQVACPPGEVDALQAAAEDLNERMLAIRASGRVFGLERIAVMAALNITHDHLELRRVHDRQSQMLTTKSAELVAKIDRAISPPTLEDRPPDATEAADADEPVPTENPVETPAGTDQPRTEQARTGQAEPRQDEPLAKSAGADAPEIPDATAAQNEQSEHPPF